MDIDWSKITKDTYYELLEYKNEIHNNKSTLSLLLLDIKSIDCDELLKTKNDLEKLINECDEINEILDKIII